VRDADRVEHEANVVLAWVIVIVVIATVVAWYLGGAS
jgi:hypothetical protein